MIIFGLYTKSCARSNWKIEWRRKTKLKVSEGSCRSCLSCFIAVVLDLTQRSPPFSLEIIGKQGFIKRITKRDWQKSGILISGAETSRAEMEKGRNVWGSNPKRAETSGNLHTAQIGTEEIRNPVNFFAFFFWMGTQMDIFAKTFKQMQYHGRVFMCIYRMYTRYDTLFLIYFLSTSIFSDFVTKFCCDLFPFAG